MGKKSVFRKRMELKLGLWSLKFFQMIFKPMPYRWILGMGRLLGAIGYRGASSRRRLAIQNLETAFPDWTDKQRQENTRKVFMNFGMVTAEFLKTSSLSTQEIDRIWSIENKHYFDEALEQGKGAMLIAAHIGNWELAARGLVKICGYPVSVVARDADDPDTTEMVNRLRQDGGYDVFARGNAARHILKALKQNRIVAILPDQNADDLFIEFFGHTCGSAAGPAVLHLKTGSPLIPAFPVRLPDGNHVLQVKPPIEYHPTNDFDTDVKAIMQLIHSEIEAQIRQYPDQWLWIHDRWRSARKKELESTHAG